MILTRLIGGLGNQMFQYAAGKRLSELHNTELKLDISPLLTGYNREYSLDVFNICAVVATREEIDNFRRPPSLLSRFLLRKDMKGQYYTYKEPHFQFDEQFLSLPDNTYLEGYWQSWKYFDDISDLLRRDFSFKSFDTSGIDTVLQQIRDFESVAIHIRLGDYLKNPETNSFHGVCSPEYYDASIEYIVNRVGSPHLFVFSDDISLAKERYPFSALPVTYVEGHTGEKSHLDMFLMSQCRHFIIANSTFSWWGAWLGSHPGKIVIAPEKWFNDPGIITKDLYLPDWIQI